MEKLNLVELLKDCPSGIELNCTMYDSVTLLSVDDREDINFPIKVVRKDGYTLGLTKYGQYTKADFAKCIIFPKGKTTWEGFQRPFKDGDVVFYNDMIAIFKEWGDATLFRTYVTKYLCNDSLIDKNVPLFGKYIRKETRFATEEEKQKLFDTIKANGYKWNPETKTLEKLVEPKFKVGDRIKSKDSYTNYCNGNHIFTITEIRDGRYWWSNRLAIEYISKQNNWELVHDKFDITTLKPFESRVLVRTDDRKWVAAFYSHYDKGAHLHHCVVGGLWYEQCIPYNDETKHLLDTTDDCDEYYKTWE